MTTTGDPLRLLRKLVQEAGHDRPVRLGKGGTPIPTRASWPPVRRRFRRKNWCETGPTSRSHSGPSLDDRYHRDRSPIWSKSPFPSSSATGAVRAFIPGNFEGLPRRPQSRSGWRSTAWNTGLNLHRYGVALQKRFFDHFLKGRNNWKINPGAAPGPKSGRLCAAFRE